MLKEVVPTRQVPGEPHRTWFIDDDLDLIVWFSDQRTIIGFQLCSSKGQDEHALTWYEGRGYSYERVDDGEGRPGKPKMSPILLPDGRPDLKTLSHQFSDRGQLLPPAIRSFVLEKISDHNLQANQAL